MKAIKEMDLNQALDALRNLLPPDLHDDAHKQLADRIGTLLYEQSQRHDAYVDALENKINSIEDKYRWIPVSERMPTKEDANRMTQVLVFEVENESPNRTYNELRQYDEVDRKDYFYTVTHWRRIDAP